MSVEAESTRIERARPRRARIGRPKAEVLDPEFSCPFVQPAAGWTGEQDLAAHIVELAWRDLDPVPPALERCVPPLAIRLDAARTIARRDGWWIGLLGLVEIDPDALCEAALRRLRGFDDSGSREVLREIERWRPE